MLPGAFLLPRRVLLPIPLFSSHSRLPTALPAPSRSVSRGGDPLLSIR